MAALSHRTSDNYEESYSDRGTGSAQDVSVWRPLLLNNEYRVSYLATGRAKPTCTSPVVQELPDSEVPALAAPTHFECVWTDAGTGGPKDGSLWKPIAPSGYVALSDVAIHRSNNGMAPGGTATVAEIDSSFRCVHASLVTDAELSNCVWTDAKSGGRYNGACWDIRGFPGMRASRGGANRPPNQQFKLKSFTASLYKDMTLVFAIENPLDEDQPDAERTITQGMTNAQGQQFGFGQEVAAEISVKASSGIPKVASSEMSAKFSAKLSATQSFSSSSTSTQTCQMKVPFKVKARTRTELWQMVVSDSKSGGSSGSFVINSEHWELRYISLDD